MNPIFNHHTQHPLFTTHRLLSEVTTFGIGGPARYFIEVKTIKSLQEMIQYCLHEQLPYMVLGKGSNCLFADQGFNGVVIANRIDFFSQPMPGLFYVGAGYSFSLLGSQTARQGWSGLEFASGIPGSVGGAVYMNAGANGQQTCDTLVSVDYITEEGHYLILPRAELQFAYRTSPFQTQKGAIAGATFQLESSSTARNKQLEIIRYRQDTQPYNAKSAGCVFRNPSCASAGALIQQCGLKGVSIGGAQISEKHANFLINHQNATAQDILDLIHLVQKEVYHKMEISLDIEICYIPYIENALYD